MPIDPLSEVLRRQRLKELWDIAAQQAATEQNPAPAVVPAPQPPKGWHPYDTVGSAKAAIGAPVAVSREQALQTIQIDTVKPACRKKSEWDEFMGTAPTAPRVSEQAPTMKMAKVTVDQKPAMGVVPMDMAPVETTTAVTAKAKAIEIDTKDVKGWSGWLQDWASWMWNSIAGGGNSSASDQGLNTRNGDGSVNPFASVKELTPQERARMRKATVEMSQLMDKLRELLDDDQFEAVMHLIVLESINSRKEGGEVIREQMIDSYRKKIKLSKEQIQKADELLKAARNKSWFKEFETVATTLGLAAAALTVAGSTGWAIPVLIYLAGTTYNAYKNNIVEKSVAKGVAWAGHEVFGANKKSLENKVAEFLRVGIGVANGAIAIGIGGVSHWLGIMMQGTMQIVGVALKRKSDKLEAGHYKLSKDLQLAQKGIGSQLKKKTENFEHQKRDEKLLARIVKTFAEMRRELLRF